MRKAGLDCYGTDEPFAIGAIAASKGLLLGLDDSPETARALVRQLRGALSGAVALLGLRPAERILLGCVTRDLSNQEITAETNLRPSSINVNLSRLFAKLNIAPSSRGQRPRHQALAKAVDAGLFNGAFVLPPARPGRRGPDPRLLDRLSPRERRVALLVAQGFSNEEIAARLGLAHAGTHTSRVYRRLNMVVPAGRWERRETAKLLASLFAAGSETNDPCTARTLLRVRG